MGTEVPADTLISEGVGWHLSAHALHGEPLLVVSTSNPQHVPLELISEGVGWHLSAHALLVEGTNLVLIIDLDQFLAAGGREGEIYLHISLSCRSESSNIS